MTFTEQQPEQAGAPFRVVVSQVPDGQGTHFRPDARLEVTAALRTSGLLRSLPGDEVKTLLLILTYLTTNGLFLASPPQVAEAMQVSESKVEQRLRRLQNFTWQGEPLLREQARESGLRSYGPASVLVSVLHTPEPQLSVQTELPSRSNREVVIAHSRAAYAHPRAEVERVMAEQNGWEVPDHQAQPSGGVSLFKRLQRFGILPEQAESLIAQHPMEEIVQQLEWLPYRNARKPGPLLVAAIENRYAEPLAARQRRLLDEAVHPPETIDVSGGPAIPDILSLTEGETLMLPTDGANYDPPPPA